MKTPEEQWKRMYLFGLHPNKCKAAEQREADAKRQKELAKQKKKREEEMKRAKELAKKAAAPKAKAVRGAMDTHQRDPDAGSKPRKRSGTMLDESQRGKKRLEVPSAEGRPGFKPPRLHTLDESLIQPFESH